MTAATRLISLDDAGRLAELLASGREFFAPWEPLRDDAFFTEDGQDAEVRTALDRLDRGEALPHVILNEDEQVVGRITLSGITHGAFHSCSAGYWDPLRTTGEAMRRRRFAG